MNVEQQPDPCRHLPGVQHLSRVTIPENVPSFGRTQASRTVHSKSVGADFWATIAGHQAGNILHLISKQCMRGLEA